MWIIMYHSYLRGLLLNVIIFCKSMCLTCNSSWTRNKKVNILLTGLGSTMWSTDTPRLYWETIGYEWAEKISLWDDERVTSPELKVLPGLASGLDHSWYQIASPQLRSSPDWRISCLPLPSLSHFPTCPEGSRVGIQSEDEFLDLGRPQLFLEGIEPICILMKLIVFVPLTLLLPECP